MKTLAYVVGKDGSTYEFVEQLDGRYVVMRDRKEMMGEPFPIQEMSRAVRTLMRASGRHDIFPIAGDEGYMGAGAQ